MSSLARLLASLDARDAVRAREFERLCRWFLKNDPVRSRLLKEVWLWKDWPDRWGPDAGIDIVAETRAGDLWAIQAKLYDPGYWIKKSDVDSFLAESSRAGFTYRLVIATTNRIGANARRTIDGQRVPAGLLMLGDLQKAEVQWPRFIDRLGPVRTKGKEPRPHNQRAVAAVVRGLRKQRRGQLIMACGTGKTLVGLWTSERMRSTRTLVLVPSLSLLSQTLREWCANAAKPFEYLAFCSDATVQQDELIEHASELGFPVTTDPAALARFLRRRGRRVVFATYQSSPQIGRAFRRATPGFDLAVADEAHRCAGPASGDFATILDDKAIRASRRLFMTATPRYFTGRVRREAQAADYEIASMDDEARFGPVLHRLSFGDAISQRLLSDYQVAVVGVSRKSYRDYAVRGRLVTLDGKKVTDARTLAGEIGVAKAMRRYDLRRVLSFHSRVKWAQAFSAALPEVVEWLPTRARPHGRLWSRHISGAMPSGERDVLLDRLRNIADGERGLLANARCLGEGVDVPSVDAVAFIDPRRSQIDIVQAVGRAIRRSPEKKIGTVILPVFIDAKANPDAALSESAFVHVWDVLKALRAHDEELAEQLDELRRELGSKRTGSLRLPGKIRIDLPTRLRADFARTLRVHLVQQTTPSWEFWFGLLSGFVAREGHAAVPDDHREQGWALGRWVSKQRQRDGTGQLLRERAERLEALAGWTWDPFEAAWEEGFRALTAFVSRQGHAQAPSAVREDGYPLGQWVVNQRIAARRKTLTTERKRRLDALTGWSWDTRAEGWTRAYDLLRQFAKRHRHAAIPQTQLENGFRLGQWVFGQRQRYARGLLSADRVGQLEAVPGWVWGVNEAGWERGFRALEEFVRQKGHARVPTTHLERTFPLGQWVGEQRTVFREGGLSEARRRRLEAQPRWAWNRRDASWDDAYRLLAEYVKREGHPDVPANHLEARFRLGKWVAVQQSLHRDGRLRPDRVNRLRRLLGWRWAQRN